MDELEFRRRVLAQPQNLDSEVLQASQAQPNNRHFVDDILHLDEAISATMHVEAPPYLANQLLRIPTDDAQHVGETPTSHLQTSQKTYAKRALSIAASVAFVVGLAVGQINWSNVLLSPAHASLAQTAIEHVMEERSFVDALDEHVTSQQFNAKMSPFAFQFDGNFPYHIYYLNHCSFGDSNAVHMVFAGKQGKVTLFFTSQREQTISHSSEHGMTSMVQPIGNSSLILVGEQGEDLTAISQQLQQHFVQRS